MCENTHTHTQTQKTLEKYNKNSVWSWCWRRVSRKTAEQPLGPTTNILPDSTMWNSPLGLLVLVRLRSPVEAFVIFFLFLFHHFHSLVSSSSPFSTWRRRRGRSSSRRRSHTNKEKLFWELSLWRILIYLFIISRMEKRTRAHLIVVCPGNELII